MQSALDPAGPVAADIATLIWLTTIGAAAIWVLVMALLLAGAWRGPRLVRPGRWVIGGGVVFPAVVLAGTLAVSLRASDLPEADVLRVEVIGAQWWWEVRYPGGSGASAVITANELHLPAGRTVELELRSSDVIHAFWAPSLAGKMDMVPGRTTRLRLRADRPGFFRAPCAEYCGLQHALMALPVLVHERDAFDRWLGREAQPARSPDTAELQAGREAFLAAGCGGCHTIRGEAALGALGPDLTHVGARRMLAGGLVDVHVDGIARWLTHGQAIKPGNRMPPPYLDAAGARAVAAYLASLR